MRGPAYVNVFFETSFQSLNLSSNDEQMVFYQLITLAKSVFSILKTTTTTTTNLKLGRVNNSHKFFFTTPKRWGLFLHLLESGLGLWLFVQQQRAEMTSRQFWAEPSGARQLLLPQLWHAGAKAWEGSSSYMHEIGLHGGESRPQLTVRINLQDIWVSYLGKKSYSPNQVVPADNTQTKMSHPYQTLPRFQNCEWEDKCFFQPYNLEVTP